MAPLPSMSVTANLKEILGITTADELTESALSQARVVFTSNFPEDAWLRWGTSLYRVPPVGYPDVRVNTDGDLVLNDDDESPVLLLAQDDGLNVRGLQWHISISFPAQVIPPSGAGQMRSWWFDAVADGENVDLKTTIPVVATPISGVSPMAQIYSSQILDAGDVGIELMQSDDQADAWIALGVVPDANLPNLALVTFKGHKANQAAMLATTGEQGDWIIRDDSSTVWVITGSPTTSLGSWTQWPYPAATWAGLPDKPAFIGAGATAAAARAAIDAQQSGSYRKAVTITNTLTGAYKAFHRASGANGTWIAPEHTLEGYRTAIAMGANAIDLDVQETSDGVVVCIHDASLFSSTGILANVIDYPFAQLPPVDFRPYVGQGWGTQAIPTLEEVLAEFGGRVVVNCEPKDSGSVTPLINLIKSYGLEQSVMCNSPDDTVIAQFAAAGIFTERWGITSNGNVDSAVAAGANILQIDYASITAPLVTYALSKKGAQVKHVASGPVQRRYDRDIALGLGVDTSVSDAPGYLDAVPQATTLAKHIASGRVGPGWLTSFTNNGDTRLMDAIIDNTGVVLSKFANGLAVRNIRPGDFCGAKATTYSLEFWWKAQSADSGIVRPTFRFGVVDDRGFGNDADVAGGYSCDMRQNGIMRLYSVVGGVATQLGAVQPQTPAQADGAVAKLKAYITPTTIAIVRTDVAAAVLSAPVTAGTITALPVNALPAAIASGTVLRLSNGQYATTSALASIGATSISITSLALTPGLSSGASQFFSLGPFTHSTYRGNYIWVSGSTGGSGGNGCNMWLTELKYTAGDA